MRLFNIINELDSDAALKSDVRDMIFLAKGEKLLSLDFNKLITNLTDMNHSIDDEYLKTILNDIPAVKSVSDNEGVLDVEAEVQDISAERQDQLGDRVNDIANDNAMAGIKDDLV